MSYDLRRLRLHGLIRRIPGRNRYVLTDDGLRFAVLYTKLRDRSGASKPASCSSTMNRLPG